MQNVVREAHDVAQPVGWPETGDGLRSGLRDLQVRIPCEGARNVGSRPKAIGLLALAGIFLVTVGLLWPAQERHDALAERILEATGVKGGLVVHLGCGDGRLTAALCANDSYVVHGLDATAKNVEKAREHIRSLGLYGEVSVEQWRAKRLPYADDLVNLLVSERRGKVSMDEVLRVLAPNGVAYIKQGGKWTKTVKPRPEQIDEWTHYLHDPSNNAVAHDTVVGPPHHVQWVGGPKWARSHDHLASLSALVSSGGRVFYIVDEGPVASVALEPKWLVCARDAFSGVDLWQRPAGPWEGTLRGFRSGPAEIARRLVAIGDRVYVTLGYGERVSALDAATGQTIRTYDETEGTTEIICCDGILYLVAGDTDAAAAAEVAKRRGAVPPPHSKRLLVLNAETGDVLWRGADADAADLMPTTLAVSDGRVFFQNPSHVVCLDAASGGEIWRAARPVATRRPAWSAPTLVVYGDVVLSGDRAAPTQTGDGSAPPVPVEWEVSSKGGNAPVGELIAFSAKTGEPLWSSACRECYNAPADVLVTDGLVWNGNLVKATEPGITRGLDVRTGEVARERPPDQEFFRPGMTHHRCHRNKATARYLLVSRAGVEWIDVSSGRAIADHWVRGGCQYGIMPCNGLLYAPPHSCACFIESKLDSFNCLAPRRESTEPSPQSVENRLERGPAYAWARRGASGVGGGTGTADWPTYRHDPARSGFAETSVPAELQQSWSTHLGGRITSPVVAEGLVLVAQTDAHTVCALDAENGQDAWRFMAGGRVDSPPTVYGGLALFGSADGWVYCLRASDGQLVWRFRAAPADRRVVAYGQLESAWPVPGSVLVEAGTAYCAAGRSSFLDGGMRLLGLDPTSGEERFETRLDSRDPETGEEPKGLVQGFAMLGGLPDVPASDGDSVYLRQMRFDQNGREQKPDVPHLFSPAGFLDDSWWHRTYWIVGTRIGSGWGGWARVGNQTISGRLLVQDTSSVYGYGRTRYGNGIHLGLGDVGHHLFAASRGPGEVTKPAESGVSYQWSREVPLIVRAMVFAGRTLFVAGPRDLPDRDDDGLVLLGEAAEAVLWAVSPADGAKLAEYELDSQPVFDGMAAANGRLYLATRSGEVLCLAGR